jgi:hypothetical protein
MSASSSSSAAEGRRLSKGFTSQLDSSSSPAALAQQEHDEDRPSIDMSTTRVDRGMDVGPGPLLIEVSNEVCRKSGGIYTVLQVHTIERERERVEKKKKKNNNSFVVSNLQSKVPVTKAQWDNRYALIGVYDSSTAAYEFEPLEPSKLSGTVREKKNAQNAQQT